MLNAIRKRWPTIRAVSQGSRRSFSAVELELTHAYAVARPEELKIMIECLGLSTARSRNIIKMAKMWLDESPTPDKVYKSRVTVTDGMKLFCFFKSR
jgi:endonuclease III